LVLETHRPHGEREVLGLANGTFERRISQLDALKESISRKLEVNILASDGIRKAETLLEVACHLRAALKGGRR
jgi:hypothetical protein